MLQTPRRFLARERELGVLSARLAAAADSRGGVVAISGSPGIGTTSLARQAADMARDRGMAVAWGECRESLLDRPFGGLADALESAVIGGPTDEVLADLGADAGPILRVCPALAGVLPTIVPAVPLEPVDERLRIRAAFASWMTRLAARAPLLVVIDEYQFADGDLRQLVEHLNRRLREVPVLVVTVASVAPVPNAKGKPRKRVTKPKGVLDALELDGLDEGAVAALLGDLSDRPLPIPVVELIHAVAQGNPLMSVELYRHLLVEDLLPASGAADLPRPAALPQTIAQVVAWRAARLPAASRSALNVLAAFPRGATAPVVATVAGVIRGKAVEALEALVAEGLVTVDEAGPRFSVFHPAVRVALLEAMTPLLRAQLQRKIAEVLDADAGNERRQRAGELAHYWFASNSVPGRERGLGHFLLATEQARAAYAHQRAVDCLRAALTVAPEDQATTFDLTSRLAMAQAAAGLRREALASAQRVLELSRATAPTHAADREPPSEEALAAVTETLRTLRADGIDPDAAHALEAVRESALTMLGTDRSARTESLPHARLMLLAEDWQPASLGGAIDALVWGDLQPAAATTLWSTGTEADKTELMLVQRPRNRSETAAAAEAAKSWRRPAATLRATASTVTDLVTRLGLFGEGADWAAQYIATADRYGSPRDRIRARALMARCQVATGSFAAAQDSIDAAAALMPAVDGAPSPSVEMLEDDLAISRLALAHFLDGDWTTLLNELPPTDTQRPAGLLLDALRCVASKRVGRAADAGAVLDALVPALADVPPLTLYRDAALVMTVAAMWELGAAEHAASGLALFNLARNAGIGGQPEASLDLTEARLLALAGRVSDARTAFAAARTTAQNSGFAPQVALIDFDEAVAIAAAGGRYYGQALILLSAAGEKFERLGMRGWSDRVSSLTLDTFKDASAPGGRLFFTYPRGLTRREADVVRLLAAGVKPNTAATELDIRKDEFDKLLASALNKLRGRSVDELPQLARKYGLGGL
jgi:DNA-binding NarL/FixJ family response regulator